MLSMKQLGKVHAVSDLAVSGPIPLPGRVEQYRALTIQQTTDGQWGLLSDPADTSIVFSLSIANIGSAPIEIRSVASNTGIVVNPDKFAQFMWNGSLWVNSTAPGNWKLLTTFEFLEPNVNYILLVPGVYSLPAGSFPGDTVQLIAAVDGVSVTNPGFDMFSAPGVFPSTLPLPTYQVLSFFSVGAGNWSVVKQFDSRVSFANQASGVLGTTADYLSNVWQVNQTTAGQAFTFPVTDPLATFVINVKNTGTQSFTIEGSAVVPDAVAVMLWNGVAWTRVNTTITPGSINDLSDVDTVTVPPLVGNTLQFDGTNWIPAPASGSSYAGIVADAVSRLGLPNLVGQTAFQADRKRMFMQYRSPQSSNANWIMIGEITLPTEWSDTSLVDWSNTELLFDATN